MDEFKLNPNYAEREKTLIADFIDRFLLPAAFEKVASLKVTCHLSKEPLPFKKRKSLSARPIHPNEKWGNHDFTCAWFHVKGKIPFGLDLENLLLNFQCGGEALLYDQEGNPIKGFSDGVYAFSSPEYRYLKCHYPLKKLVHEGKVDLWLDAGDNIIFPHRFPHPGVFQECCLEIEHPEHSSLLYDIEVLWDYLTHATKEDPYFGEILEGLRKIRDLYVYDWPEKEKKGKEITNRLLSLPSSSDYTAYAVGHSHLDLAWLWPYRESKRKAIRTISNALYLIKKYPNFVYSLSQPQQVEWIKEEAPTLFQDLVAAEKEGRIDLVGGGWVEHDVNNVGEEALMRQMLLGQKFWKEHFGHYAEVGWLPDTFGFSPSLPEVLKSTNQFYFLTCKMSWSWATLFPYSTFQWKGLDGSSVLTHFGHGPNGYHGFCSPSELLAMPSNNLEEPIVMQGLLLYGNGDGGGGPSVDMEEGLLRMDHNLNLPHILQEKATTFFHDFSALSHSLPTYQGELYLEAHQGTYTSQSNLKQWNRRLEEKLKVVEIYLAEQGHFEYDAALKEIWKQFLLYQVHDVLAGSSIARVNEETEKGYQQLNQKLDAIMKSASEDNYSPTYKKGYYVRNFSQYPTLHEEKKGNWYYSFSLPANGNSNVFRRFKGKRIENQNSLVTKNFMITFAEDGSFLTLVDNETGKDVLEGYGNKLRVFIDGKDPKYANWNLLDNYRNQPEQYMKLQKRGMKRYGPIIEINDTYAFKSSFLRQTILINDDSRIIKIHHEVDWHDDDYLLKACFAVRGMPPRVRCDTQFGYHDRSTLNDTPHRKAQFECATYKWIDLSYENCGVSFFNKTKSGFYAKEGKVELSLLRSANYPCPHMDQKPTSYDYAIYVHNSSFAHAHVDELGNLFNAQVLYFKENEDPKNTIFVTNPSIVISCFKTAYSGDGLIVRLYDSSGLGGNCALSIPASYSKVTLTNALEEPIDTIDPHEILFRPFEIKTIWIH